LNEKNDKAVWLKWMEQHMSSDVDAIATPTGNIPRYADLKILFNQVLHAPYTQEQYNKQFTIRINENLAKINRMMTIFQTRVLDTPEIVFKVLKHQQQRLMDAQTTYGEYILPKQL